MDNNYLNNLRNIGIIAHIDAGKTTTTERILFCTGILSKMGEVHDGGATTDWMEEEKERGITITSAATKCQWKVENEDFDINIIDTPGHVDFTIEVERSLRVLDGAVCVFDGVAGVQTQTITVWKQANKHRVPRIVFVNKLDREGANFFKAAKTIETKLNGNPVIINIPVEKDGQFIGIIDLITEKFHNFPNEKSMEYNIEEIPENYRDTVKEYRDQMIESIIVEDEDLMEKYMDDFSQITVEEIEKCIKLGTLRNNFVPVFAGSAYKNKGVQLLLDAVVKYLPSPLEVGNIKGTELNGETLKEIAPGVNQPFCGLAFKLMNDPFVGSLTFIRVYSGQLDSGVKVFLPRTKKHVKLGRMVQMHANKRSEIKSIRAGDIVAVVGGDFITGDTLCYEQDPILLESITPPEPVISMAITANTKEDKEKLSQALPKLNREDPSFGFEVNQENDQTIIKGMGELHLEIIVNKLRREFKVNATIGNPIISYKETIGKEIDVTHLLKKQSGGAGQFAGISMKIRPRDRGGEFKFIDSIVGGTIPKEYLPAIEKGVLSSAKSGALLGYPIIDFEVEVYDGRIHDVDSSALAFEICARTLFRENISKANLILLEPIMRVDVNVPGEFLGGVMGDLSGKRGIIIESTNGIDANIIADVPLAEMTGYIKTLREKTRGCGTFSMEFNKYEVVPQNIVNTLSEKL